jgi:uncharacterized membrane protein YqjE
VADAADTNPRGAALIRRYLRAFLADGSELVAARVELLTLDLRELALRVVLAALVALLIAVCLLLALGAAFAALLFALGVEHGLALSLATLAAALLGAGLGWLALKRLIDPPEPPFAATVAELARDREAFREPR